MAKSQDFSTFSGSSEGADLARQARLTVRQAFTGSLATLDPEAGYPFASLVSVAASAEGDPLLLLSGLARHTKNIAVNGKASLLMEAPLGGGDPLAASRVTVQGDIAKTDSDTVRARYLMRHPEAAGYAEFSDFAFYQLNVSKAHFIAGFGRIHTFDRADVCVTGSIAEVALNQEQAKALSARHQDVLKTAWRQQVGSEPRKDSVQIVACDADGLDARVGEAVQRINFATVVEGAGDIEAALQALDQTKTGQ